MLEKNILRKLLITTCFFVIVLLVYLIPINNYDKKSEYNYEYVTNLNSSDIYLLNSDNFLVKTKVILDSNNIIENATTIIENLKSKNNNKYPSNLKGMIPINTNINSIKLENNILYIDFNDSIMEIKPELEEKVIEALVYSLTNLDKVEGIVIKINGKPLTTLPKSGVELPDVLTKKIGINKIYNINSLTDITKIVTYYVTEISDKSYFVPVTEYVNSNKDKIKIIIENLSSSYIYETNLMSYLSSNTNLINYEVSNNHVVLNFDDGIFNNNDFILEEVIYSISASIFDNYDVEALIIKVNNEKILTKSKKDIDSF